MPDFNTNAGIVACIRRYLPFEVPSAPGTRYRVNLLFKDAGDGKGLQLVSWYFLSPTTESVVWGPAPPESAPSKDPAFYYNRGLSWFRQGEYDKAIKDFDDAIRLDPGDAFAYHSRGDAWLWKKVFDKAIKDYDEAIRLNPNPAFFYLSRAYVRSQQEHYDEAILDYERAIERDPNLSFCYTDFAWLLATCPEGKIRDGRRAIELARKACELTGWKSAWELTILAAAYAEAGQFDEAVSQQSKALEDPRLQGPARDQCRQFLEAYKRRKPIRARPVTVGQPPLAVVPPGRVKP